MIIFCFFGKWQSYRSLLLSLKRQAVFMFIIILVVLDCCYCDVHSYIWFICIYWQRWLVLLAVCIGKRKEASHQREPNNGGTFQSLSITVLPVPPHHFSLSLLPFSWIFKASTTHACSFAFASLSWTLPFPRLISSSCRRRKRSYIHIDNFGTSKFKQASFSGEAFLNLPFLVIYVTTYWHGLMKHQNKTKTKDATVLLKFSTTRLCPSLKNHIINP